MKYTRMVDSIFKKTTALFALTAVIFAVLLVLMMMKDSLPAIKKFSLDFLFTRKWDPVEEHFGAVTFIYGTIVASVIALLIAVPVSLSAAFYLAEFCSPRVGRILSFLIELLAAVPSVIYGLWGIFVLVSLLRDTMDPFLAKYFGFLPLFQGDIYGVGMLSAGMILGIMIIPTITSVSKEVFLTVPQSQREAAFALGATRFETIKLAVWENSKNGVTGAVILGLGRALGETMAVTMVIGNKADIPSSLFAPASTMASVIANEFTEAASDLYVAALIEIGLILFAITLLLNVIARLLIWKTGTVSFRH